MDELSLIYCLCPPYDQLSPFLIRSLISMMCLSKASSSSYERIVTFYYLFCYSSASSYFWIDIKAAYMFGQSLVSCCLRYSYSSRELSITTVGNSLRFSSSSSSSSMSSIFGGNSPTSSRSSSSSYFLLNFMRNLYFIFLTTFNLCFVLLTYLTHCI